MSAELIEKTREHVAALEAELEKWRAVLTLLGGEQATPGKRRATVKAAKAKPGKKAAAGSRPTTAGKTGRSGTSQRVSEYLAKHPGATSSEIGKALGLSSQGAAYHLKKSRAA